jgi:N-acetylglucosaminyldiphosphoundecaprenol N-acetyl-beta-D-mannosaminyltransferase
MVHEVNSLSDITFLGITVDALTKEDFLGLIKASIEKNKTTCLIGYHNLHSLYIYHHSHSIRKFYHQANFINIDGMPLVFLGRFFGYPLRRRHRLAYVDLIHPLMEEAAVRQWRVFFIGSKPGVAAKAEIILKNKLPGLQLRTMHGYFDVTPGSKENQIVLESINEYKPNILMVGMGMPRQECWVTDNLNNLTADVILTTGACMDYVAGAVPTPPRWMGQLGMEWLYRLFSEPKRLWRRYLLEPWFILKLFLLEIIN